MKNALVEAIETPRQLPEAYVKKALKAIREIKDEHKEEKRVKCSLAQNAEVTM